MKRCPKCSTENWNSAEFCKECGSNLSHIPAGPKEASEVIGEFLDKTGEILSKSIKKIGQVCTEETERAKEYRNDNKEHQTELGREGSQFIDSTESIQAALGTGYLKNYLSGGKIGKEAAILTEKRLYYYRKKHQGFMGLGSISSGEEIIPLEEISSTRFTQKMPLGRLLWGILFVLLGLNLFGVMINYSGPIDTFDIGTFGGLLMIIGIVLLVLFYTGRITTFEIFCSGNSCSFDTRWYSMSDMRAFQSKLYLMRDNLQVKRESAEVAQ